MERALRQQVSSKSEEGIKKLVTVSATSTLVTVAREEAVGKNLRSNLTRVLFIYYPINFGKKSVLTFFDSSSEVNAVHLTFAKELGQLIRPTDVGAQKIDGTTLETYEIVVVALLVKDKANQIGFFEETFLVANVSPKVVFGMLFFILSGADVDFLGQELWWWTYTTEKALPTIRRVKLVGNKTFVAAVLDLEYETYVVHIRLVSSDGLPSSSLLDVHPF